MGPVTRDEPRASCGRSFQEEGPSPPGRPRRGSGATTYTKKWLILGVIIGVVAGLGAVVFYEALRFADYVFLQVDRWLQGSFPGRRGGGTRLGPLRSTVGHSDRRVWRSPPRRHPRLWRGARRRRTRYGRGHRGRASQPARNPTEDRVREDRRVGPHNRLRRLGRTRRTDGTDQCRFRFVPRAILRPQPVRRTDRRRQRDRLGHRFDIRCAPRWRRVGHRDHVPRRLRG